MKPGDTVRCIAKKHSFVNNLYFLEVSKEYTVRDLIPDHEVTLEELPSKNNTGYLVFHVGDFEISNSLSDAYERAMGVVK